MTARKAGAGPATRGVRWPTVRRLALSFPGMAEGTSYGEHAFLLDGKFFSRFNAKEQGLVLYAEEGLRDALLASKPDVYFTTDHYRGYPYVLARLERLPRAELAALFEEAFRAKARKRRVAEYDARGAGRALSAGRGRETRGSAGAARTERRPGRRPRRRR